MFYLLPHYYARSKHNETHMSYTMVANCRLVFLRFLTISTLSLSPDPEPFTLLSSSLRGPNVFDDVSNTNTISGENMWDFPNRGTLPNTFPPIPAIGTPEAVPLPKPSNPDPPPPPPPPPHPRPCPASCAPGNSLQFLLPNHACSPGLRQRGSGLGFRV